MTKHLDASGIFTFAFNLQANMDGVSTHSGMMDALYVILAN